MCKEHIAVAEAKKLNIPTFAIVDTNADPNEVDFPIPGNDDAAKSIEIVVRAMVEAIEEGLNERRLDKEKRNEDEEEAVNNAESEEEVTVDTEDTEEKQDRRPRRREIK